MSYWGSFASCYGALAAEQTEALERAICLTIRGQYPKAEAVFSEPPLQSNHLLIVIERASLYERIGLERKRADIIALALDTGVPEPTNRGRSLWDLATVLHANANIFAYGSARPGLQKAFAVGQQLASKVVEELSDVEIRTLLECHKFLHLCRSTSNWLDDAQLQAHHRDVRLPSILEMRTKMQQLGLFMIAHDLLKSEASVSRYSDRKSVEAYTNYFEAISGLKIADDECVLTKLGVLRIFYARELVDVNRHADATVQLDQARTLLWRAASLSDSSTGISPRIMLLFDRAQCSLRPLPSKIDQISRDLDFQQRASLLQDYVIQRVHLRAAIKKVEAVLDSQRPPGHKDLILQHRDLLLRYMRFESEELKVAYYYITAISDFGVNYIMRTGKSSMDLLQLIDDFAHEFPKFELPKYQRPLMIVGANAADSLNDRARAQDFKSRAFFWHSQCPNIVQTAPGLIEYKDLTDDDYISEWYIDDFKLWCESYMTISARVLLRYILAEKSKGLLNEAEKRVFTADNLLPAKVTTLDEISVRSAIFGPRELHSGKTKPVSSEVWNPWLERVEEWLLQENRPPSKTQRQHLLYQLQRCRAQSLQDYVTTIDPYEELPYPERRSKQLPFLKDSMAAQQQSLKIQNLLDPSVVSVSGRRTSKWCDASNIIALSAFVDDSNYHGVTNAMLTNAILDMSQLEQEYESEGNLLSLNQTCASKARAMLNNWMVFQKGSLEECLKCFLKVETTYNQSRVENDAGHSSRSFLAKINLTEGLGMQSTYSLALLACLLVFQASKREANDTQTLAKQLFRWTQKSKARALTDLMGLSANPPLSIMGPIKADGEATLRLEVEKGMINRLRKAKPLDKFQIRAELKQHIVDMRQDVPILAPLLDIRQGSSISLDQLHELEKDLGANTVIFEWVHFSADKEDQGDLLLIIYKKGLLHYFERLKMKLQQVTDWVHREMDIPSVPNRPLARSGAIGDLQVLDVLVEPILKYSKPGDTLIFCPTKDLHRIPLHAISPRETLLIERNPIHYCQSLSLLRLCQMILNESMAGSPFKASVLNTLSNESGSLGTKPSTYHIDNVAKLLQTKTVQQKEITKSLFRQCARESCIVHVHGHIGFDLANPLQHHLALRDPPQGNADKYTTDEIFDTPFHRPSLILAMGCNGGRSKSFECDDLLGLTAAFHYSGASSVISTLWKVSPADCMRFSKAFYTYLMDSMKKSSADGETVVDVALAFQKAVVDARKNEKEQYLAPYSWAAFYLHGAGKFSRFTLS